MPFNAGGQTYIGGQLLAQGLGDFGKGIGGGIMEALEEQRKKQQLTDQIMLQALEQGHATPEQYLEYSKKNTKGKQDYAMTVAANFADEYKQRIKEQHDKATQEIAQSKAATDYNTMLAAQGKQATDVRNAAMAWAGPTPEDQKYARANGYFWDWDPQSQQFKMFPTQGPDKQKTIGQAPTDAERSDAEKHGFYPVKQPDGSYKYESMPGFKQGAGAETGDVQVKGIPDPFHPGKYLTNKVIVKQPGEDSKIVDMPEEHGMTLDPDFGVPVYKSSGKAVEGSAIQAAFIGKKLFKGGQQGSGSGSGGGSDAEKPGGDAGSGVPSTYGAIKDFFKQFVETPSSPSPTPSPTPSPSPTASPLDQIIQQITPTPSPMPSAMPSQTPMPSATPTGTPLDQIMSQMGIDQPEIKAALSSVMGAPPADQAATQNMNLRTDTAAGGALDQIIKKIADASKEAATGKSRKLDKETATQLLIEAGGDKVKARKLAIIRGYDIK